MRWPLRKLDGPCHDIERGCANTLTFEYSTPKLIYFPPAKILSHASSGTRQVHDERFSNSQTY